MAERKRILDKRGSRKNDRRIMKARVREGKNCGKRSEKGVTKLRRRR